MVLGSGVLGPSSAPRPLNLAEFSLNSLNLAEFSLNSMFGSRPGRPGAELGSAGCQAAGSRVPGCLAVGCQAAGCQDVSDGSPASTVFYLFPRSNLLLTSSQHRVRALPHRRQHLTPAPTPTPTSSAMPRAPRPTTRSSSPLSEYGTASRGE